MTVINTNTAALNAQSVMQRANNDLSQAMGRLASGQRINAAKDDAAGMAIAEKMTSQVMGLNQAVRNATDGKNLIDTTEGAHVEISNMLQRVRELAVQSANDTNTSQDRAKINAETKQLITEINRVSETTTFNGMKVLDGSFGSKQFQIGADAGQTISINVDSASATAIGSQNVSGAVQVVTDGTGTAAQDIKVTGAKGEETVTLAADASAKDAAAAINGVSAKTGVTATATTKAELSGLTGGAGTMTFELNGSSIGNVMIADANDLSALRDAINNVSGATGITAALGDTKGKVVLTSSTGENIKIEGFQHTQAAATATDATLTVTGMDSMGKVTTVTGTLDEAGDTEAVITGTVEFASDKSFVVTNTAAGFTPATSSLSSLSSVAEIDLSSTEGAAKAIQVLDMAIEKISESRSNLGAVSNRLDSTISNLTNISTNIAEAKSQIMDADFAQESTALARAQILSQASTAMLAQANASKQGVLSLLRG